RRGEQRRDRQGSGSSTYRAGEQSLTGDIGSGLVRQSGGGYRDLVPDRLVVIGRCHRGVMLLADLIPPEIIHVIEQGDVETVIERGLSVLRDEELPRLTRCYVLDMTQN